MKSEHMHLRVRCKKCTTVIMECSCPSEKRLERWEPSCQTCLEIDSKPKAPSNGQS